MVMVMVMATRTVWSEADVDEVHSDAWPRRVDGEAKKEKAVRSFTTRPFLEFTCRQSVVRKIKHASPGFVDSDKNHKGETSSVYCRPFNTLLMPMSCLSSSRTPFESAVSLPDSSTICVETTK